MKISTLVPSYFKLDGGAMFGVVPKQLWKRLNPPDEQNMCTWAMRCLLIETETRKILVDTGIGDKQDAKFRKHFEPHRETSFEDLLAEKGLTVADITDVFLTHLHFDHVGGAVKYDENGQLVPRFPKATYWSNEAQYNWALNPNPREKASFLKENFVPLQEAGVLKFIEVKEGDVEWIEGMKVSYMYGHTEALMMLKIPVNGRTLVYCADAMPASYHIPMPYVMSYDIRPLQTLREKKQLLEEALEQEQVLIFEHDPTVECGTLKRNEKGRIVLDKTYQLAELLA